MAKKKSKKVSTGAVRKRRPRRSPETIIEDLQAEISRLRNKATARELKNSPAIRSTLSAVRQIDKGLEMAAEEGNAHLRHALADARRALAKYLENKKLKLPKANLPKGRRPK